MKKITSINILIILNFLNILFAQDIIINEVLPNNISQIVDKDGDRNDWFELYNPNDSTVNLSGFSISSKSGVWSFPDWEMEAGQYTIIMASAKNRNTPINHWESIINSGDIWRYQLGNSGIPANWNTFDFDDSNWETGATGIGYGDDDDTTEIERTQSLYLRKTFALDSLEHIKAAVLHIDFDDSFVAYLNGVEIARANIGVKGVPPGYDDPSIVRREARMYLGGTPLLFQVGDFDSITIVGENVLAIQVNNEILGSTDLSAIPFLSFGYSDSPNNGKGTADIVTSFPSGMHTNFTISSLDDTLRLLNNFGDTINTFVIQNVPEDKSAGRIPDGSENINILSEPTPAEDNYISGSGDVQFQSSNLPIIVINTDGQSINDEPKITADMGIIYNGEGERNNITDPFNDYQGKIGIEIRGWTSQIEAPKKPYGFETRDSLGANRNVSLIGLPEENDWILQSPYSDKSLIRNVLMYKSSNNMGMYASRTKFCELVLNGEYQGIYVLMEKIKRDKNRVNIANLNPDDTTGVEVSGGYIIQVDRADDDDPGVWRSSYPTNKAERNRMQFISYYPKAKDLIPQQQLYIQNFIFNFETALYGANFKDPDEGYQKYINVGTFVDFFLLNEFSNESDAYRLSTFMHKDKDTAGGKLSMGPIWDFNIGLGNHSDERWIGTDGWRYGRYGSTHKAVIWFYRLLEDDFFKNSVYSRWFELREDVLSDASINHIIDSSATLLDEAKDRNFQKWDILDKYVWPDAALHATYAEEVSFLKEWTKNRLDWMDANMLGEVTSLLDENAALPVNSHLFQNYPNPFNPVTNIEFVISKTDFVTLKIYNLLGQEVASLVSETLHVGSYSYSWDAGEFASGVYLYRLETDQGFVQIRKLVLLK